MRILPTSGLTQFLRGRKLALNQAEAVARPILAAVRRRGDRAVAEYTRRFDNYDGPLCLGPGEMSQAWREMPVALQEPWCGLVVAAPYVGDFPPAARANNGYWYKPFGSWVFEFSRHELKALLLNFYMICDRCWTEEAICQEIWNWRREAAKGSKFVIVSDVQKAKSHEPVVAIINEIYGSQSEPIKESKFLSMLKARRPK